MPSLIHEANYAEVNRLSGFAKEAAALTRRVAKFLLESASKMRQIAEAGDITRFGDGDRR